MAGCEPQTKPRIYHVSNVAERMLRGLGPKLIRLSYIFIVVERDLETAIRHSASLSITKSPRTEVKVKNLDEAHNGIK